MSYISDDKKEVLTNPTVNDDDDFEYSKPEISRRKYYIYGGIFIVVLVVVIIIIAVAANGSTSTQQSISFTVGLPCIISTSYYPNATRAGWIELQKNGNTLDAVVKAIQNCTNGDSPCINVSPYQNPNLKGEVTLDAMIFYGNTHDVGGVTNLRNISDAIGVAKYVLLYSNHSILQGNQATLFAKNFGFNETNLGNTNTMDEYNEWIQPTNENVRPCYNPPLIPGQILNVNYDNSEGNCDWIAKHEFDKLYIGTQDGNDVVSAINGCQISNTNSYSSNHDSIGVIAINSNREITLGRQSNGAKWKTPGSVSAASIPGSGGYVDKNVGACVVTGKEDILLKFSPAKAGVLYMKEGNDVQLAAEKAMFEMRDTCKNQEISVLCVDIYGNTGIAFWTESNVWQFTYQNQNGNPITHSVQNTWD